MRITVRYFAAARELAGCSEEELDIDASSLSQEELRERLAGLHQRLTGYLERMRFALNGELADGGEQVTDGDQIDVLPPVAGGSPFVLCELQDEEISVDRLRAQVAHPSCGAIALFVGTVRDHAEGKFVARLDYEAHKELAQKEMERVLNAVVAAYPNIRIAASHRVGSLAVGDVAVVVAVGAPHRKEAIDACSLAIERIKESVPIWKKEWGADGVGTWVNLESK